MTAARRTFIPSAASTSSARSAIAIWPNAVGCTWSAITQVAGAEVAQVETSAPLPRADASIAALTSSDLRAGARAAEVERHGHGQHAVAALGQERQRASWPRSNARPVPVERRTSLTPMYRQPRS